QDLLAQLFNRAELYFISNAGQEMDLNLGFRRDLERMKIEQMALDGERIAAEGWAVSDIGDRIKTLAPHPGAGDVDAVARHQLFVWAEIQGGDRVFRAVTAAAPGNRLNAERASQQVARATNIAGLDQFANARTRDRQPAHAHLGIDDDFKTK